MSEAALPATIHASCVRVGTRGVLIRGPSGSGKSHLAFALILAGRSGLISPTELVADDRVRLDHRAGRLVASAPPALAGLIEIRGAGIRRLPFAPEATVDLIADLAATDAARLPDAEALRIVVDGVAVERLPVFPGGDAVQQVLAVLLSESARD